MNTRSLAGVPALSILFLATALIGQTSAVPPGDFDGDGDVDILDFGRFQRCTLGSNVPQDHPQCAPARLDADQDVDLDDFAVFLGCFNGDQGPVDPNCACTSDQTNCDGICADTASDEANCGACGNACASNLVCSSGSCAPCGGGATPCSGVCTHIGFDPLNCGGCGIVCPETETCSGGTCQSPWRRGAMVPGDFDDDSDVDLADFAHFQTCALGPEIAQTNPVCSNAQIDADQDVDLDDFEMFQGCLSGADHPADPNCACASGETNCDGTCTNTQADSANCGACGNACPTGVACQNGSCNPCGGHFLLCGEVCVDPWINTAHCGGCGISCAGGQNCVGGVCQDAEPCWDCGG